MHRQEFLDKLRAALTGRMNESLVNEHVRYYENYITTEMRNGRSEEEIIQSLGDPRLLARTIREANKHAGMNASPYSDTTQEESGQTRHFKMPLWLILVFMVAVILILLTTAFSVFFKLLPIIIPIMIVVLLVKAIRYYS